MVLLFCFVFCFGNWCVCFVVVVLFVVVFVVIVVVCFVFVCVWLLLFLFCFSSFFVFFSSFFFWGGGGAVFFLLLTCCVCYHNPLNYGMDYRIHIGGLGSVSSKELLQSWHKIWLWQKSGRVQSLAQNGHPSSDWSHGIVLNLACNLLCMQLHCRVSSFMIGSDSYIITKK